MEHVCNMSELHRKSTPTGTPTGTPTRVGAGVRTGAGEVGGAGAAVVSAGGLELPLRDPLSSVILQEIRARKEAARGAVARADAEAGAEAAERKRRGRANAQEGRQGQGQGTVTASSHPAGIAESSAADQSSSAGGMSLVRQQQLEKMVKNILARLEKVSFLIYTAILVCQ